MIQKFAPDDNPAGNEELHRHTRTMMIDTEDDDEFTIQEVTTAVQDIGNEKAPGEEEFRMKSGSA